MGVLNFININLEVGCELPLDNREAMFRFSLASRAYPFLISAPPYGGGVFFGIETQATDIVMGASPAASMWKIPFPGYPSRRVRPRHRRG